MISNPAAWSSALFGASLLLMAANASASVAVDKTRTALERALAAMKRMVEGQ